jgi:hypothetical protein
MDNIFLCKSCQSFGFCRKHYKVASEKVIAEFDQTFYKKVNSVFNVRSKIEANAKAETNFKLVSLEAIRSLYRTDPVRTMLSEVSKYEFVNDVLKVEKNESAGVVIADLEPMCI